jgi:hypothetical protein
MCSAGGTQVLPEWVTPFGNPRLGLLDSSPRLFAVLPRPSSALDTKASTMCLNRLTCFRIDIRPYSVVKVPHIRKRLGDYPPSRRLATNHRYRPYVITVFIATFILDCELMLAQNSGLVNQKTGGLTDSKKHRSVDRDSLITLPVYRQRIIILALFPKRAD